MSDRMIDFGQDAEADESHELGLHQGEALWSIAADTYRYLMLALLEGVQNGTDADADKILVVIDVPRRVAMVCDNGTGITVSKYKQALMSVCKTIKPKVGTIGRFGRGMISGLNKAKTLRVISRPVGEKIVNSWTFVGEKIKLQEHSLTVPYRALSQMPELWAPFNTAAARMAGPTEQPIDWNTMLVLDELTQDSVIGAVDPGELEYLVRTKLGRAMRDKGVTVWIMVRDGKGKVSEYHVDPRAPQGRKLEPFVAKTGLSCGDVTFELYLSPRRNGKRIGDVGVLEAGDLSPVTMIEFRTQATGLKYYRKDHPGFMSAIQALESGLFEGSVWIEKIGLNNQRDKFEADQRLKDAYTAFETWYDQIGRHFVDMSREEQEEERYTQLGKECMEQLLKDFQRDETLAGLAFDLRNVLSPQQRRKAREKQAGADTPVIEKKTTPEPRVLVRPPDTPPSRNKRNPQPFINLAFDILPGSKRLWEFDPNPEDGNLTLTFNTRHPDWLYLGQSADGQHNSSHDEQLIRLQKLLVFEVLWLLRGNREPLQFEAAREYIDARIEQGLVRVVIPRSS